MWADTGSTFTAGNRVTPKFQRLVVDAYAAEKRIISLASAGHNSPIEGAGLVEFQNGLDWLIPPMWEGP